MLAAHQCFRPLIFSAFIEQDRSIHCSYTTFTQLTVLVAMANLKRRNDGISIV